MPAALVVSEGDERLMAELRRKASLKLSIAARQLRRHFDNKVAEIGVTRSQWTLISAVARLPGATQRSLAQILEISEASAGRLVDRLCDDGLLERRPKSDDRRAYCVHLTENGAALISKLTDMATEHEAAAFGGLNADDVARLDDLLERMLNNVGRPSLDRTH